MAELILTEQEKADLSYLDWSDEALGKLVRKCALEIKNSELYKKIEENDTDLDEVWIGSALVALVGLLRQHGISEYDTFVEDHRSEGCVESINWKIRIVAFTRVNDVQKFLKEGK